MGTVELWFKERTGIHIGNGRCKTKEEVSPSIEALVQAMGFLMKHCGWAMTHECFGESSDSATGDNNG